MALEQRRLDVVAARQVAFELRACAAYEQFGAFFPADGQVGLDLLHLLHRRLRAHHAVGVQRAALLDGLDAGQHALHELVVDRFLDQRP